MRSTGLMVACRPPPILAAHIAADDPAQFAEPLQERCIAGLSFGIVHHPGHKHADAPNTLRLLRARRERPRGCAADQRASRVEHRASRDLVTARVGHRTPEPFGILLERSSLHEGRYTIRLGLISRLSAPQERFSASFLEQGRKLIFKIQKSPWVGGSAD